MTGVCVCKTKTGQETTRLFTLYHLGTLFFLSCAFFVTLLNTVDVTRCQEAVKSAAFSEAGPYMLIKISGKVQAAVLCLLQTQPAMTR